MSRCRLAPRLLRRPAAALFALLLLGGAARADELAFLGPRGTYSEQATDLYRSRVKGFDTTVPLPTITAVAEAIRKGEAPRGIIPAVATTGFPVESTKALLGALDPGFRIVGEVNIPIDIDLMVKPGTKPADIKAILSHPNALGEAADWLRQHYPDAKLEPVRSTAAAAEQVSRGDGTIAAVAGPSAAKLYGLDVLAERVQDNKDNRTSFWAIVKPGVPFVPAANRIAVNIEAPAGSLAFSSVVAGLRGAGFSVVNVNSVPLHGPLFGYRYMIYLAAEKPVLVTRLNRLLAREAKAGHGETLLLGAWMNQ